MNKVKGWREEGDARKSRVSYVNIRNSLLFLVQGDAFVWVVSSFSQEPTVEMVRVWGREKTRYPK